jgi:4-carboxymuconolactone decarboxylase
MTSRLNFKKNKRVSDSTFNRAEQRFGKKGVVDMTGISGYYTTTPSWRCN